MKTVTDLHKRTLEPSLQALAEGATVERLDEVVNQLVSLTSELESISCLAVDAEKLQVTAWGTLVGEQSLPLATAKLRMLCARVATRFSEGRDQPISPYGDEFDLEAEERKYKIRFENTSSSQLLEIQHSTQQQNGLSPKTEVTGLGLLLGSPVKGLQGVETDLDLMDEVLSLYGFRSTRCVGPKATRDGILQAYQDLIDSANKDQPVFIYYSGHGGLARNPRERFETGAPIASPRLMQFLVPTDIDDSTDKLFRGITSLELSYWLEKLTKKTKNVTLAFDCCHSWGMSRTFGGVFRPRTLLTEWTRGVDAHVDYLASEGIALDRMSHIGNEDTVRLMATTPAAYAYEYEDPKTKTCYGLMTHAIATVLKAEKGKDVSWRYLIDQITALVQEVKPEQRPQVEGASDRIPFRLATLERPRSFAVIQKDTKYLLEAGHLQGVEPGDTYAILPRTSLSLDPQQVIAEAQPLSVLGTQSVLHLQFRSGLTELPKEPTHAFLKTPALRKWVVNVDGDTPFLQALRKRLEGVNVLRVHATDEDPEPLVQVKEDNGKLVMLDKDGHDYLPPKDIPEDKVEDLLQQTETNLIRIAKAESVATLKTSEQNPLGKELYEVVWGLVGNGVPKSPRESGQTIHVGDRVWVQVRNLSTSQLFVSFLDIGVFKAVQLVNEKAYPLGIPINPNSEFTLGKSDGGTLQGIELHWPENYVPDRRRDETIVAIISDQPCNLSSLSGQGIRSVRSAKGVSRLSQLEETFGQALEGGRTRDAGQMSATADLRYAVVPITFTLDPTPATSTLSEAIQPSTSQQEFPIMSTNWFEEVRQECKTRLKVEVDNAATRPKAFFGIPTLIELIWSCLNALVPATLSLLWKDLLGKDHITTADVQEQFEEIQGDLEAMQEQLASNEKALNQLAAAIIDRLQQDNLEEAKRIAIEILTRRGVNVAEAEQSVQTVFNVLIERLK